MIPKADLKATARARLETKHLAEWSVILDWDPEKRYHATGLFTEQQARDIVTAATKLLSTL